MTRVALLGATGSIGRQAIEIVERNPELELCALMSGTQPLAAARGRRTASSTSRSEAPRPACSTPADPDIVLNAIVGFAGVEATLWTLERGVTLALANKESLVAAGELAVAAHRRGGGLLLPVDSEHSAIFQCLEGREPETVDVARPDRVGWSVPRTLTRGAASTSRSPMHSHIQLGRWDERSPWTPPHSRTRASS